MTHIYANHFQSCIAPNHFLLKKKYIKLLNYQITKLPITAKDYKIYNIYNSTYYIKVLTRIFEYSVVLVYEKHIPRCLRKIGLVKNLIISG